MANAGTGVQVNKSNAQSGSDGLSQPLSRETAGLEKKNRGGTRLTHALNGCARKQQDNGEVLTQPWAGWLIEVT